MIKAVIFDCFGVLVGKGFWNVYEDLGGDAEKDAAFIDDVLNKVCVNKMSREEFHNVMAKKLGVSREKYDDTYEQDEKPNQDVFAFIRTLKPKYKIGLLSNAMSGSMEHRIPPNLLGLFDAVVVSGDVGLVKPDPKIYRLAAERLGVKPDEAVFTDDHDKYLPGAREAGMHTVFYKNLDDFKKRFAKLAEQR